MVRVAVFTDEPILQMGLAAVLRAEEGFDFVPLSCRSEALCEELGKINPDVFLVDLSGQMAFQALERVCKRLPACRVLLWMREVSIQLAHQAMEAGVRGIVRKNLSIDLLLRCLRAVAAGELWFERGLTQCLHDARTVRLTRRETQLLRLVGQGLSNKEIADILFLSEGTVKYYFSRLFKKMGVNDRFELALYGLKSLLGARPGELTAADLVALEGPRSIVLEPTALKST